MFNRGGKFVKSLTSAIAALVIVIVALFLFSGIRSFFAPSDLGGDVLVDVGEVNTDNKGGEAENLNEDTPKEKTPVDNKNLGVSPKVVIKEPKIIPRNGSALLILEGSHPKSTLVPEGAIGVPYTQVKFVAPQNEQVDVEKVVIEHTGLFDDGIFTGIILLDEQGRRMGTSTPLDAKHQARIDVDFTVAAGNARTLTVAGDMATDLGDFSQNESFLAVVDVVSTHEVDGDFPIVGAKQRINPSLQIGEVKLTAGKNTLKENIVEIQGDTYQTFTSIAATAGAVENILWKGIRFYQSGDATDKAFKNLILQDKRGKPYQVTRVGASRYYQAIFDAPILMERGDEHTLTLRGIITGESGAEIDFDIRELIDVQFTGTSHNYDIRPEAAVVTKKRTNDDATFGASLPQYDSPRSIVGPGNIVARSATEAKPASLFIGNATTTPILHISLEAVGEIVDIEEWKIGVRIDPIARAEGVPEDLPVSIVLFDDKQNQIGITSLVNNGIARIVATTTIDTGSSLRSFGVGLTDEWEVGDRITLTFDPGRDILGALGRNTGKEISVNGDGEMVQEILIIDTLAEPGSENATSTEAVASAS